MSTNTLASNLPMPFDLQWIAGDTINVQFFFKGINWVDTNPSMVGQPTWVDTTWEAQVRRTYMSAAMQYNTWVPLNGYQYGWYQHHSGLITFAMDADLVENPAVLTEEAWLVDPVLRTTTKYAVASTLPTGFYTKVRLHFPSDLSAHVYAGLYRWDLQTQTADEPPVRTTHLRGRCRVITQWTML